MSNYERYYSTKDSSNFPYLPYKICLTSKYCDSTVFMLGCVVVVTVVVKTFGLEVVVVVVEVGGATSWFVGRKE